MFKKSLLAIVLLGLIFLTGCTKKVVFLNKDVNQCSQLFDNFVKTTGYTYKEKDEINHIYNVSTGEYNMQYLLQSKPMFTEKFGFCCKFKELGKKDTLMTCTTYPSNSGIWDIRRFLKETKEDEVIYIPYKLYKNNYKNNL